MRIPSQGTVRSREKVVEYLFLSLMRNLGHTLGQVRFSHFRTPQKRRQGTGTGKDVAPIFLAAEARNPLAWASKLKTDLANGDKIEPRSTKIE